MERGGLLTVPLWLGMVFFWTCVARSVVCLGAPVRRMGALRRGRSALMCFGVILVGVGRVQRVG